MYGLYYAASGMATQHTITQALRVSLTLLLLCAFAFCSAGCRARRIKEAERADGAARYAEAAELYQKLYRSTPRKEPEQKGYFAYKAAENYRMMRNPMRALSYYRIAHHLLPSDSASWLVEARLYEMLGRYEEARKLAEAHLMQQPDDAEATAMMQLLSMKDSLAENRLRYHVREMKAFNSARSDFAGVFAADGGEFIFSSARSRDEALADQPATGEKNNQLFSTKKNLRNEWSRPDSISGGINNGNDNATPALTPDGSTLYYTCVAQSDLYDRTAKIYRAARSGEGGYAAGTEVPLWDDSTRMAAHPALSPDGSKLVFVSTGGYGGKDLYSIAVSQIGVMPPTNLGSSINTSGDEMYPSFYNDSTLYFASDGHPGLGGLDIYCARLNEEGEWEVSHPGSPINSSFDDYGMAFNPTPDEAHLEEGYFASSRNDRRGYPHLFSFYRNAVTVTLEGYVSDREGYPIEGAVVRLVSDSDPLEYRTATSRVDGFFTLQLDTQTSYLLLASHADYLNQYLAFATDSVTESETYEIEFFLASRKQPEVFSNIYYDFDKATLRPESETALQEMAKILKENPEIRVLLSSHADRHGPDAYNQTLSEQRAHSVVAYLITLGIEEERLEWQGFGKTRPRTITESIRKQLPLPEEATQLTDELIATLSEEQQAIADQLNRRTEFVVIGELQPNELPAEDAQAGTADAQQ